jgi:glucose/arabinose dehydrogenase
MIKSYLLRAVGNGMLTTAFFFFAFIFSGNLSAQNLPSGFSRVKVATLDGGMSMAFAPDGRLFVCQKNGAVRIIKNNVLLSTPFMTLNVAQDGERGISGITFHPNFATNKYIYIYYTATSPNTHNRLSRFTANGDVVVPGSEVILLDIEPVNTVYHNGGGIAFGPDGKLYLSIGEDNSPNNAQNLTSHKGKLLRLNDDGTTPSSNPFFSSSSSITKRIWAYGLRNPYTLDIQPGTGKIFINDVGADLWEEINDATSPGKNFGWPAAEGNSSNSSYSNPVFAYPHESSGQKGCAITGGVFFNPTVTNYPNQYIGKYFYMDFCNGWFYYLGLTNPVTNTFFASNMVTQNLAFRVGPDGNLYYINRYGTSAGIYKIIYTNNNSPVITNQPQSQTVPQGQPASFSVSVSGATPLSYQWKKNGNNITGATSSTYTIQNTMQSDAGQYTVFVSNSYGSTLSNPATLTVTAFNAPPNATITTPSQGATFRAGDTIYFAGTGTDPEDGNLPNSAYVWTIELWHNNNHFHPGPIIPPNSTSGSFVTSKTDHQSASIFYRIKLKVTDANGLKDTAYVDVTPITSTLTFNTVPPGLQIIYASQPQTTPFTTLTVEGNIITISAVSPQTMGNQTYAFDYWLHGGSKTQNILVGQGDSAYTAVFKDTVITCNPEGNILREHWANVTGGSSVSLIPVNTTPTSTSYPTILEGPTNIGDNYGARFRGFICAPSTGNYTFWIASDNNSELWLSTNDNPSNKQKIASVTGYTASREWTKYTSQQSAPISLVAGGKYYIEVLHKESTGGDNVAVGWQLPNATYERPIPGSRLSPYNSNTPPPPSDENLILAHASWKYLANGSNQGTAWRTGAFNDASWSTGNAELGYGDGDETTIVSYGPSSTNKFITTYFRKTFNVTDASDFTGLELSLIRDDGAVVYINGVEVYRTNMPSGTISYNTLAPNYIDGTNESTWVITNINNLLVDGNNLIAVEIHQNSPTSSDISFNLKLKGTTGGPNPDYITANSSWKYLDNGSNQGTAWRATSFNDASWLSGNAQLGYGDGDETTVVSFGPSSSNKFITTYFRKSFNVTDASAFSGLELSLIRDDGAVVYINGTEVYRTNMPTGTISYTTLAPTFIDGTNESTYVTTTFNNILVNGTNVIAVEIHQNAGTSSDISFNLKLKGTSSFRIMDTTSTTTSSEKEEEIKGEHFIIYPNPNSGKFTLEFCMDDTKAKNITVEIINALGQSVFLKELLQVNGCIREVVELDESLASGVYIMNLITDGYVESKRIVLRR